MMAIDVKELSGRERVWVNSDTGEVINVDRAWQESDVAIARRQLLERQLAKASMDVVGERQWFALRTVNKSEFRLRDRLINSRIDAVVPEKQASVRSHTNSRSRKVIHKPVLSHLVFVNIVPSNDAFAGLLRVKDVGGFIGVENGQYRPYPIGDRQMNGFMDLAQAGAFDERNMPTGLKVGSRVRINVGPYAEFRGILEGYAKGRAARVKTWLFGCDLIVDVKLAHLEKLE